MVQNSYGDRILGVEGEVGRNDTRFVVDDRSLLPSRLSGRRIAYRAPFAEFGGQLFRIVSRSLTISLFNPLMVMDSTESLRS